MQIDKYTDGEKEQAISNMPAIRPHVFSLTFQAVSDTKVTLE